MRRLESAHAARLWLAALVIALLFGQFTGPSHAADDNQRGFVTKTFRDEQGEHSYVVFVPAGYSASKTWPVMLFLHGAGERGTDGKAHLNIGLGSLVKAREASFPAIVVFPQCENTRGRILEGWLAGTPDSNRALQILEQVEKDYHVDPKRRILTGWSMGGFGAWSLAAADPTRWSALVPLAGGGKPEWAESLKELPIWAWHGDADQAVFIERSRQMVNALKLAGASPRFTEISGGDHDSWKVAYADDRLIAWMLDPQNVDPDKLPAPQERLLPKAVVADPFIPALELPNAVYTRLGNQALEALAYAAPKQVSQDFLRGQIQDIVDYTNVDGYGFNIQFSRISYNSQLHQVRIKGHAKDRLNLQVGLRNAVLNIGATWVTGEDHSAAAGPIQVVIGHQRPVWLSVDVQPVVENRRIKLKQKGARFDIPNDNWYVTSPAGVSVEGFGMTREKVSSGLVNGLYGSKRRIENEVLAVVPRLIETVEKKLAEFSDSQELAGNFWPIPVYKPRLKFFPQEVSTDEQGVTVVLGATAATFAAAKAPKQPRTVELSAPLPANLSQLTPLQIGLSSGMLEPLTELLVDADLAHIHVLDIPGNSFAKFADRAAMSEAIPELRQHASAELWPELSLVSGIQIREVTPATPDVPSKEEPPATSNGKDKDNDKDKPSGAAAVQEKGQNGKSPAVMASRFEFHVPKLVIATSLKLNGADDKPLPFAVFEIELTQQAAVEWQKPDSQSRAVRMIWEGEPTIRLTTHFADGYTAKNNTFRQELLENWLKESWKKWTSLSDAAGTRVPDLDFGLTKLRLSDAGWTAPHLFATFSPPGVKLTNSSQEQFVYETKGPYSDWGGPYKLEPGKSHEFEIAYPLTYRRNGEVYTLAPGSHSEFRVPLKGGAPRLFQARE